MENPGIDVAALMTPPDIMSKKCALCIQPHPDDNEIGMGGTVAALAAAGCRVCYLTVTNGDKGNKNPNATCEETAAQRHAEALAAGRHLGVSEFYFLDHGDGTINDVPALSDEIGRVIAQVKPDVVFMPDPFLNYECHWDHVVTGRAAANAAVHLPMDSALAFYFTAAPNRVVDITDTFEKKFEAIAIHDSQMTPETLALYRVYFGMKGQELAVGKGFALGEGFKVLSPLHCHCFVDAERI